MNTTVYIFLIGKSIKICVIILNTVKSSFYDKIDQLWRSWKGNFLNLLRAFFRYHRAFSPYARPEVQLRQADLPQMLRSSPASCHQLPQEEVCFFPFWIIISYCIIWNRCNIFMVIIQVRTLQRPPHQEEAEISSSSVASRPLSAEPSPFVVCLRVVLRGR